MRIAPLFVAAALAGFALPAVAAADTQTTKPTPGDVGAPEAAQATEASTDKKPSENADALVNANTDATKPAPATQQMDSAVTDTALGAQGEIPDKVS